MRSASESVQLVGRTTGKYNVKIDVPMLKRLTGGLVGYRSPSGTEQRKAARGTFTVTKEDAVAEYAHAVQQGNDNVNLLVATMNRAQRRAYVHNAVMHSREIARTAIGNAQKQARRAAP